MKGINKVGTGLVMQIFENRPYSSVEDFLSKVKVNKTQMISLIKAGTFDNLYRNEKERKDIMYEYLSSVADKKKRITLQNMRMLIEKEMIPSTLIFEQKLFNFNKYIKSFKDGEYYILDNIAMTFFTNNYCEDTLEDIEINGNEMTAKIKTNIWDNTYKRGMEPVRIWMKANQESILNDLNNKLMQEIWDKYAKGSLSKWEMDSLGFYYHKHELADLKTEIYEINNFFSLSEEPEIDRVFTSKDGFDVSIFKIHRIAGTVIDKDKNKSSVTLLTPDGVVVVKVWKNQFAKWDKQLSERGADGVKHVVEKSWFQRGNKLIITGIRRGDNFIPKKYKNTEHEIFEKILEMDERGFILSSRTEREEVDE